MILSIIIPIYNTSQYLDQCFSSILSQKLLVDSYEIIAINDGSTDNSLDILKKYSAMSSNIRIVDKENEGVSKARNLGIQMVRGEYLMFVDSDDYLFVDSLQKVFDNYLLNPFEILIARSFIHNEQKIDKERYAFDKKNINRTFNGVSLFVGQKYGRGSVCGCLFNKKFIDKYDIKFNEKMINAEDSYFMMKCFIYADSIRLIDEKLYIINERADSASRHWTFERLKMLTNNLEIITSDLDHPDLQSDEKAMLNYSLYSVLVSLFGRLSQLLTFDNYFVMRKKIKNIIKKPLNTGRIKQSSSKVALFNFSYDLFAISIFLKKFVKKYSK